MSMPMSMLALIAALALQGGSDQRPPAVFGRADWQRLPALESNVLLPTAGMMAAVERVVADGGCSLPGQSTRRIDLPVRYAVRYDPAGAPAQILVQDLGCRPLEALVGDIVADLLRLGHLHAPAGSRPGWYASMIHFNLDP